MKYYQYIGLFLLLGCLLTGCAGSQNLGKLVQAAEVTQIIETASVLPDHTYYFAGSRSEPDAIIAINNSFTLKEGKSWTRVDNIANQLESWNRQIDNAHRIPFESEGPITLSPYYTGAKIITPDGRQAGIWYSRHDHTVIESPDPSTVIIYAPDVPVEIEVIRPGI